MAKITKDMMLSIEKFMAEQGFTQRHVNGFVNFNNNKIFEGIEINGNKINPFKFVDGDKIYSSDVSELTRSCVTGIENIINGDDGDQNNNEDNGDEALPDVVHDAEIIENMDDNEQQPVTGVLPKYLTDALINKHPGSISALMSLQKTHEKYILEKPGKGGTVQYYVSTGYMTTALNWAFLLNWSFEVIESREDEIKGKTNVSVLGQLTAYTTDGLKIVKTQWGSQVLLGSMEFGDALKGATSDSLKKCASMLNIAADVYGGVM